MLAITVFTKSYARKGPVGGLLEAEITTRDLAIGDGSFTIRRDNKRWPDLMATGARVVVSWNGQQVMSGLVSGKAGESGDGASLWTFTIDDDYATIATLLAWPVPGSGLGSQTVAYDTRTGPAETVLKALVTANATRLSLPVTTATNLARGTTIKTSHRFHPLLDRLPLETMGVSPRVTQVGTGQVVDVYEPVTRTTVLKAPVVRSWDADIQAPTVTRVVAGNQGDAEARVFRGPMVDSARETLWGIKREAFVDARDTDDTTETDQRMAEVLAEGGPTAAARVVLAEAGHFQVGSSYELGDQVSVLLDPDLPVLTERVREITYRVGPDQAPTVTPVVGALEVPEAAIPKLIAAVRKNLQNLART